jgi:tRNA 2-thiouridine synthesizing protein B
LGEGDALLLLGDGVYAALAGTAPFDQLVNTGADLYVLESDAAAAGILSLMDNTVRLVDFDAFVALSEEFTRQQAWY